MDMRAPLDDAEELTGMTPRFVPRHNVNVWRRKDWQSGFNAGFGVRYLGERSSQTTTGYSRRLHDCFGSRKGIVQTAGSGRSMSTTWFNNERYFLPGHFDNLVFPGSRSACPARFF